MTTIAYRDGKVAVDTQATSGGWVVPKPSLKYRRLEDGSLAVISGEMERFIGFVAWLEARGGERPCLGDDTRVIHFKCGKIMVYEGRGQFDETGEFGAWGSGWPAAVGALFAGATARQAVEIAAKVDPYTGGEVIEIEL
jgi:ATP-dependent protease HslVU (ClpYQ) peptidase subunit